MSIASGSIRNIETKNSEVCIDINNLSGRSYQPGEVIIEDEIVENTAQYQALAEQLKESLKQLQPRHITI